MARAGAHGLEIWVYAMARVDLSAARLSRPARPAAGPAAYRPTRPRRPAAGPAARTGLPGPRPAARPAARTGLPGRPRPPPPASAPSAETRPVNFGLAAREPYGRWWRLWAESPAGDRIPQVPRRAESGDGRSARDATDLRSITMSDAGQPAPRTGEVAERRHGPSGQQRPWRHAGRLPRGHAQIGVSANCPGGTGSAPR
jgi:hypothetical protein